VIHRIDKERESCRKYRSKKGVRCDGAGGVALKVVNQVVECALEYGKESKAYQTSSNTRRNPRNFSAGCPAKKEETTIYAASVSIISLGVRSIFDSLVIQKARILQHSISNQ